jgi:tol-pal system protein YbgF
MTTARLVSTALLLGLALAPARAAAQSRQEVQQMQVLQELRMLQEQVQQLRGAVAALAEQAKATNTRLDLQAETVRTNHANDSATLKSVQDQVSALGEKMNLYTQQVGQLGAEIPSLRAGQQLQQKSLDKILTLVSGPTPTSPADASAGAPPAPGTQLPPSPSEAFKQAKDFYFSGDYTLAAQAFADFLQKFPTATAFAAEANNWLGLSLYNTAKYPAAITAFSAIIDNYKTSDKIADAYYQRGECYRALGKKSDALADYDAVIKLFPDSNGALQAKQRRPLVIK